MDGKPESLRVSLELKNDLFSQRTYNFQYLRNETMVIDEHEYVNISKLARFHISSKKVTAKRRQHNAYLESMNLNEYQKRFECRSLFLFNQ